jgi:hypothetical protein
MMRSLMRRQKQHGLQRQLCVGGHGGWVNGFTLAGVDMTPMAKTSGD